MGEITSASHEQTLGIEQINKAIAQMDQNTQQNAALVEEAAAASQSMQEQADKLARVVGFFATGAQAGYTPAPASSPARAVAVRPKAAAAVVKPAAPKAAPKADEDEWQEF
jgi:methyl-accepting chemotaxis protein